MSSYGITRAEIAAGLRAAARGAAKTGNVEQARALRAWAARAASTVTPYNYRRWPEHRRRFTWSLAKSASAVRRARAAWRAKWREEERIAIAHRLAFRLGGRTLIAMTCARCGKFLPGDKFKRHIRNKKDQIDYIDRRCVNCKWGTRVNGKREGTEDEA